MTAPVTLKHVSFLTRDMAATLAFYTRLGAVTEKDLITGEGYRRVVLNLGNGRLQFFALPGEAPAPHPSWAEHIAVHLGDLSGTLSALQAAGVTVSRELTSSPGGTPMAFVLDPDGRQVELLQG